MNELYTNEAEVTYTNGKKGGFEHDVCQLLGEVGWTYEPSIKTTKDLWANFRRILEQNNQGRLHNQPLTDTEFSQVKQQIENLKTPYEAGQFLYGVNGVSQVEVVRDTGANGKAETVFLTVFDQAEVAANRSLYQVVNQIQRPKVKADGESGRFDVTLLINGLPLIQVELKKNGHEPEEALNQMEKYQNNGLFGDIFSTLQVLVAMTPNAIRYMANTAVGRFNKAFAFEWKDENNSTIKNWKVFVDKVLRVPMAHELATRYMILDGTKNKEMIKVMRSYQVYATMRVIDKIEHHDFEAPEQRLGYVWHTTGSGKTITSFKTAWLASRLPNVTKVVFLVDRVALTNQTTDAYRAYDPSDSGVISDTANVSDLARKLKRRGDNNIIVTSIQKMARYVERKDFKEPSGSIVFIVDEAHRSTGSGNADGGKMMNQIRRAFHRSAWVGYTGTPSFSENNSTYDIFGPCLHTYTINNAIMDKNVLGFNVEFKDTVPVPDDQHDEDHINGDKETIYDHSDEHIKKVVQDIVGNWEQRSKKRKLNGLLTVHIGGNQASTPRAMQYFDAFVAYNKEMKAQGKPEKTLKIGISFSKTTNNSDTQNASNEALKRAIAYYNEEFTENFGLDTIKEYTDNFASRLNKTIDDKNYLDLGIVVDQLLTGFDAPQMNVLYVDRTLKGAGLIQAYSRTNRVYNNELKKHGIIVNYRFPVENKEAMNKAFALYSNSANASEQKRLSPEEVAKQIEQMSPEEIEKQNQEEGILAKSYAALKEDAKKVVANLKEQTANFTIAPSEPEETHEFLKTMRQYNNVIGQLQQRTEDDNGNDVALPVIEKGDKPEVVEAKNAQLSEFYQQFDEDFDAGVADRLTSVLKNEALRTEAAAKKMNVADVVKEMNLQMVDVAKVTISYKYLNHLIAEMADAKHAGDEALADEKYHQAKAENAKLGDSDEEIYEREQNETFIEDIHQGKMTFADHEYPLANKNDEQLRDLLNDAKQQQKLAKQNAKVQKLIEDYGLIIPVKELASLINRHVAGDRSDLNKQGELDAMMTAVRKTYAQNAKSAAVRELRWLKFRRALRDDVYQLADEIIAEAQH